jgi:hypothetical protein
LKSWVDRKWGKRGKQRKEELDILFSLGVFMPANDMDHALRRFKKCLLDLGTYLGL